MRVVVMKGVAGGFAFALGLVWQRDLSARQMQAEFQSAHETSMVVHVFWSLKDASSLDTGFGPQTKAALHLGCCFGKGGGAFTIHHHHHHGR